MPQPEAIRPAKPKPSPTRKATPQPEATQPMTPPTVAPQTAVARPVAPPPVSQQAFNARAPHATRRSATGPPRRSHSRRPVHSSPTAAAPPPPQPAAAPAPAPQAPALRKDDRSAGMSAISPSWRDRHARDRAVAAQARLDSGGMSTMPPASQTGSPPEERERMIEAAAMRRGSAQRSSIVMHEQDVIGYSEPELGLSRKVLGPRTLRPDEFAVAGLDRQVVDAGLAAAHQPVLVELPVLVAIGPEPVAGIVAVLVLEAHGNTVVVEGPEFLDQAIVELALPFPGQERDDLGAAGEELGAVAPLAVLGISERDLDRILRVPGILGLARFFLRRSRR